MRKISLSCLTLIAVFLLGCKSVPTVRTILQGNMNGAMSVSGDMEMAGTLNTVMKSDNQVSRLRTIPVYAPGTSTSHGSIVVIDVDGLLVNKNFAGMGSLGENPVALFREKLDAIASDPGVAAIVLRINSSGGGVTAADMMRRDLEQVKQQHNLPVVACLMDVGAGSGYYLATAADTIFAHPTSLVGGVGVILNRYNMEDSLAQFGAASKPIKSGNMIDMVSPEREIEEDESDLLNQLAESFHGRFIDLIKQTRPEVNAEVFDGRILDGQAAHSAGLVDSIGYLDDAVVAARSLAGLGEEASVTMLRRDNDRAYTLLDITPNQPTTNSIIPLKVPGLDRSSLPTFMYLWQPDPSILSASGL